MLNRLDGSEQHKPPYEGAFDAGAVRARASARGGSDAPGAVKVWRTIIVIMSRRFSAEHNFRLSLPTPRTSLACGFTQGELLACAMREETNGVDACQSKAA